MRHTALAVSLSLSLSIGACKGQSDAAKASPSAEPPTSSSAAPPAASSSAPATASASASAEALPAITRDDPRFAQLPLFSKLAVEKQNRPASALRSDAVFDAIASKLGAGLKDRSQLAGFTVLAAFCEKADTDLAVNVVVCEYPDAATLAKGKELALKNKVAHREMLVAKTSWVSITRFGEGADTAEQAKKIAALVKTL